MRPWRIGAVLVGLLTIADASRSLRAESQLVPPIPTDDAVDAEVALPPTRAGPDWSASGALVSMAEKLFAHTIRHKPKHSHRTAPGEDEEDEDNDEKESKTMKAEDGEPLTEKEAAEAKSDRASLKHKRGKKQPKSKQFDKEGEEGSSGNEKRMKKKYEESATTMQPTTASDVGLGKGPFGMDMDIYYGTLFFILPIAIISVVIFEIYHRTWVGVDEELEVYGVQEMDQDTAFTRLFKGFWELTSPYFNAEPRTKGWTYVGIITFLALVVLYLIFLHNAWQKQFWDAFENKRGDQFAYLIVIFIVLVVTIVIVDTYNAYMRQMLYIDWRAFLTDYYLGRWVGSEHSHYVMQLDGDLKAVDNPDQRIQQDLDMFVLATINITYDFFNSVGNLLVFVPMLWLLSPDYAFGVIYCPGWLVYLALAYSLLGTIITHFVGRNLMRINFARQRVEADFRFQLVRVRDHSESVAVYSAERTERSRFNNQFEQIRRVWWEYMIYTKRLAFWTRGYSLIHFLLPFMLLAPNYFNGEISLGTLFQIVGALSHVGAAFDWVINVYQPLTEWRATADRLLAFEAAAAKAEDAMRNKAENLTVEQYPGTALVAQQLSIRLPSQKLLWNQIELTIKPGDRILISGPAGFGKSTLFRALAGVWPFCDGKIFVPEGAGEKRLFVPQRAYIPSHVTLRAALCYPEELVTKKKKTDEAESKDEEEKPPPPPKYTDEELFEVLRLMNLTEITERKNGAVGLDRTAAWDMELSPGEQQRLRIAHILLEKPAFLFLDEATANVDETTTVLIYKTLLQRLPQTAIVSITHDVRTLKQFHKIHYIADHKTNKLRRA